MWTNRPGSGGNPGEPIDGPYQEAVLDEIEARGIPSGGYGNRQTNSTGTTSIVGVLRLDDVQLRAGRAYEIKTSNLRPTSGANDGVTCTLRATTDGSTPSTSSTAIATGSAQITSVSIFESITLSRLYTPSVDQLFSVLLCVARTTGTAGTTSLGGDATYPIEIWIVDVGEAVADAGTDI